MKKESLFFDRRLQIIFSVTLISVMEVSVIAPVLPKIAEALSISSGRANLLIVVFTMPGIVLAPFFGIAADRFGRKKVLVPALLLFGICGTAAGFTKTFSHLLVLRFFQGAGSASLGSLNQTVIGDIFPGDHRVAAMGYNNSILNIGIMLYPSIGGAVAMLGWHCPFFLAALAFPVSLLVIFFLDCNEPEKNGKIKDYLKQSLIMIRQRNILSLYIATLAAFILLYGIIIAFFPFYMKREFHASPLVIGLVMSTSSIGAIIGSFNLGAMTGFFSSKKLLVSAYLLYPVALTAAYFMPNILLFTVPVVIYGFANGILIPNIQTQISILAPAEFRGGFMSVNSSVLRLGQTAGPLMSGIIIAQLGESYVFAAGSLFALAAAVFLALAVKDIGGLKVK